MTSFAVRLIVITALATSAYALPSFLGPGLFDVAHAQTKKKRGWNPLSPLMKLFGPPKQRSRRRNDRTRQPVRLKKREIVRVRKNPDARRVLVIGDRFARGLYNALDLGFAQSADISVLRETNDESGLAVTEAIDWPVAIDPILDDKAADVIVVMIGANDFVGISSETGLIQPDNETWTRAYGLRVQALLNQLARRQIPVFWVGLAPMQDPSISAHASKVTAIYREYVTLAGGVSVDIWDSFTGDNGQYTISGPDVNGRVKQLRLKDGIGFTKAGYRKVGFFVEQELRSRMRSGLQLAAIQAITDEPDVVEIGSVIPLYDSRIGLNVELDGLDVEPAAPEIDSLQYKLVVAGEALAPAPGRVDDFRLGTAGR